MPKRKDGNSLKPILGKGLEMADILVQEVCNQIIVQLLLRLWISILKKVGIQIIKCNHFKRKVKIAYISISGNQTLMKQIYQS